MPIPAATVRAIMPQSGDMPIRPAAVAPAKPTWESAWPAKVCPRPTRKTPTIPATTATTPLAAKAVRMKS